MFKDVTLSEIYNRETPFESLVPGTGIVLVGRASIGPSMVPVKGTSKDQVTATFGVDSELSNGYLEATIAGGTDIYLIRINGAHATTPVQGRIMLVSLSAATESNDVRYSITEVNGNRFLTLFRKVVDPENSENITYTTLNTYLLTGKTLFQIASEININAINGKSPVFAQLRLDNSVDVLLNEAISENQTAGGDSQLDTVDYIQSLKEILDYLEAYPISQIGILCTPFNHIGLLIEGSVAKSTYLYDLVAKFAYRKMMSAEPCIITLGLTSELAATSVTENIATSFPYFLVTGECLLSEFVNVILASPVYEGLYEKYTSFGVPTYCGLINRLDYNESTTNKRLYGAIRDDVRITSEEKALWDEITRTSADIIAKRNELEASTDPAEQVVIQGEINSLTTQKSTLENQLSTELLTHDAEKIPLSNKGYVTLKTGMYGGETQTRIYKGVNFVKSTTKSINRDEPGDPYIRTVPSLLSNISNVRLIQYVSFKLRNALDIEEMTKISTLRVKIDNIMSSVSDYINGYEVSITESSEGFATTYRVALEIVPVGEIESVGLSIQTQ